MNAPHIIPAEEVLTVLYDSPNATSIYKGEDIIIVSANAAMLALWGKDRSVVGKTIEEAIPELKNQPFMGLLQEVWRSGKTYVAKNQPATMFVEGRLQEFFFDYEYKAILDANGKTTHILNTAVEVSERMAAWKAVEEKSLQEQQLNEELMAINEEYQATNEELASVLEEHQSSNESLAALNEEYQATNEQLVKSQQDLQIVNQDLNNSEDRFRRLVEEAPIAIALLRGKEMVVELANEVVLSIWGRDSSVIGKPLSQALPEIQNQEFLDILDKVYQTGKSFYGKEFKAILKHGDSMRECYLNFVYQAVLGSDNKPDGIMVIASEVTEQVDSRKEIEEIKTRLEIALDASKLGSTEVEIATGKMKSTDQFKANFGFLPEEDFQYSDLFAAMLPEYHDQIRKLVKQAMDTNGVYKAEYPVKRRDGSLRWIQAHGRPRYDEHGKANRMVGMTLDITEQKLFEQKKDDFLSIASHELKTPITSLRASLQLLDRIKDRPYDDTHARLIEQCNKSVVKMEKLVAELLNMSRLSQDNLKLEKSTFSLYRMLTMCCNHVRMEGKFELVIEGDKEIRLSADEHRIDQVVVNFVNNAVKYAPESKVIKIKIEHLGNKAKLSVIDNGPGIKPELLPHIFDRYFRVDHSSKSYTGLGLGLYICSEIIRKHGGEIGVESVLGEGSTFWFTLPLA